MKKKSITICLGSSCFARGNSENMEFIDEYLTKVEAYEEIDFKGCLCTGNCNNGPVLSVDDELYTKINSTKLTELLETVSVKQKA